MMSVAKSVQYLCNSCNTTQKIVFTPKMREEYIPEDLNGLALYSHIHICSYGMLGVNNLYIDHNLDVRSYTYLKLPKYKQMEKQLVPMPSKKSSVDEARVIKLTQINEKDDLKMIIINEMDGTELEIGDIDKKTMSPVKTLTSDMGMITLKYFYCKTRYTSQIEKWLEHFVNTIEIIPPSKLGIIIEVIRYILENKDEFPTEFSKMIVKTILASHEIYFQNNNTNLDTSFLKELYGENEGNTMDKIMQMIEEDPLMPLHTYSQKLNEEIVYIIYCFLLLEKHGLITIFRPGIIEQE